MNPYPYMYAVVFHQNNIPDYSSPIIQIEKGKKPYDDNTYLLLDQDMIELLPIIEYILQLPRADIDLIDLNEEALDYYKEIPHLIVLIPDTLKQTDSNHWNTIMGNATGVFLCDSVANFSLCKNPMLGIHYARDIGASLLIEQWGFLIKNFCDSQFDKLKYDPILIKDDYLKSLPFMFFARQFQENTAILSDIYQSSVNEIDSLCYKYHYYLIIKQKSLLSLNKELPSTQNPKYIIQYIENNLDLRMKDIAPRTHLDVVVTFPGISKRLRNLLSIPNIIPDDEYRAVKLMGIHRAIAQNAALIEIKATTDRMYQLLDELEQQLKSVYGTNNPHIWKLLRNIGKEFRNIITEEECNLIRQAPHICVFSEYPIGIAILPGQEIPISISNCVYYEPLIPLSRQFTIELSEINHIELYKRCNILFIECIPDNKHNKIVYNCSEQLASIIKEASSQVAISSFFYNEAHSKEELKQILNQHSKGTIDILVLSAHGFYDNESNSSGLCIGEEDIWMAEDNDIIVPPIVLLSACHVSPRGRNAINASDLLMRAGAVVVLSTLIPINVYRNTLVYSRLFVYIFEAIQRKNDYKTLADLWTGVVASNAINEILEVSSNLKEWYMSKNNKGVRRIEDFMLKRSFKRLHSNTIYSDTISILKDMLAEEGLAGKYDSILNIENCFPESFFYQLLGYPENVHLIPPISNEDKNSIV